MERIFFVILWVKTVITSFMKYIAIIPARYASTRFPGKPLAVLGGKTIIERVYRQVEKAVDTVYVATDDQRIFNTVLDFGGKVVMTSSNHKSGTDRIEEAVTTISSETGIDYDVVINVQGDEPFVAVSQIQTVMESFSDPAVSIATLGKPFVSPGEEITESHLRAIENPNSPKIAVSQQGYALYFSRSVIPFIRGKEFSEWPSQFPFLKHIGLYAYRRHVLHEVTQLPQSPLELAESLEQLRWLENGYNIKVGITHVETIGIDTPEDFQRAEAFLKE